MENASTPNATASQESNPGLVDRLKKLNKLFVFTVLAPTAIATLYYGVIASDVYVSESRFVVRSAKSQPAMGVVGALLTGTAFSQTTQDVYPVIDYIQSRDALKALNQSNFIVDAFSQKGDIVSRFHTSINNNFESLWKYYGKHIINVNSDPASGITTLQTSAYTADDAARINTALIKLSEALVNRMNDRAAEDTVDFAEREVQAAALHAKNAATALAGYRNTHALFDPDKQSALRLQQVSVLQNQMFAAQTQLMQLEAISPQNPQISALKSTIASLKQQIDSSTSSVAGNQNSLSHEATEYERLQLDSQFADKQLASTMASLENARQEAERKQLYIEELVQPNVPDVATEPRRLRGIATVFALGLVVWATLTLLIASIREHRD